MKSNRKLREKRMKGDSRREKRKETAGGKNERKLKENRMRSDRREEE